MRTERHRKMIRQHTAQARLLGRKTPAHPYLTRESEVEHERSVHRAKREREREKGNGERESE